MGYVIDSGEPLRIDLLSAVPLAAQFFDGVPFGPGLIVPVGDRDATYAALVLARRTGEPRFTDRDLHRARALATILDPTLRAARPRAGTQPRPARRTDPELVE
jgi:hypothetical protein